MDKVTVKFNNGIVKTFKTLNGSEIPTLKLSDGCHAMYLHYSSIQKAKDLLNYDPEYDFARGLNEAIAWYKENL